jgi:hypothetical protein
LITGAPLATVARFIMELFTKKVKCDSPIRGDDIDLTVCLALDNDFFYVVMALDINQVEVATTSEKFTEYLKALDRYIGATP